jgi:hypothetical protein
MVSTACRAEAIVAGFTGLIRRSAEHCHTGKPNGNAAEDEEPRMPGMWRTLAVGVFSLSLVVSEIPANAQPDNVDAGANYSVFLQAIAGDGVMMNGRQAVLEGQAVCELMQPPDGGSLWDAGRHVLSMHPD